SLIAMGFSHMSIKLTDKNTVFLHLEVINIFKLMGMGSPYHAHQLKSEHNLSFRLIGSKHS
ncbi:hypothetical protein, partial [Bacillus pseudomycoides]|uniref:hypothetical protein n=1 Tax=Bacillus pseudomycoides TaxID=64104 RepID=UPI001C3E8839